MTRFTLTTATTLCVLFGIGISVIPTTFDDTSVVNGVCYGWLEMFSCRDDLIPLTYKVREGRNLADFPNSYFASATSIQIIPSNTLPSDFDFDSLDNLKSPLIDYAVMAKPCSNPVLALKNNLEISWPVFIDNVTGEITGSGQIANLEFIREHWYGTDISLQRLVVNPVSNGCLGVTCTAQRPDPFYNETTGYLKVYDACCNLAGLQLGGSDYSLCRLEFKQDVQEIEGLAVWIGFPMNQSDECGCQAMQGMDDRGALQCPSCVALCPVGTTQSENGLNHIINYGLTEKIWQFKNGMTIEDCRDQCNWHTHCNSFIFSHQFETKCSLYAESEPTNRTDVEQVWCKLENPACHDLGSQREVVANKIYACPGTISGGGVLGESAASLCVGQYELCPNANRTLELGLIPALCQNIAVNEFEFFATKETGPGSFRCYSDSNPNQDVVDLDKNGLADSNDIFGCASPNALSTATGQIRHINRACGGSLTAILGDGDWYDWSLKGSTFDDAKGYSLKSTKNGGVLCCIKDGHNPFCYVSCSEKITFHISP